MVEASTRQREGERAVRTGYDARSAEQGEQGHRGVTYQQLGRQRCCRRPGCLSPAAKQEECQGEPGVWVPRRNAKLQERLHVAQGIEGYVGDQVPYAEQPAA